MLTDLVPAQLLTLHALVTAVATLLYVVMSSAMPQRRNPTAAIAWVLFIVLLPYLAVPAFLMFGTRKLRAARPPAQARPAGDATAPWAVNTILALHQPPPAPYTGLAVHRDGVDARARLLALLGEARCSIDVCTFILGPDRLGEEVVALLGAKARSGVRVRLLFDGLGELMSGRPDLRPLTQAGGSFAVFAPPVRAVFSQALNLRQHRKLVVTDAGTPAARLWCGGRNLAAEYFGAHAGGPAWLDLTFDVGGPLVAQAAALFEQDWAAAGGQAAAAPAQVPAPAPAIEAGAASPVAQLVASGPDQADDAIHGLLVSAAYHARRRIALATPYFVPDAALLSALCLAASGGAAVDLLVPARSNHRLSDLARSRALRSLAQAGARIWLLPGMSHAKLAVFDDMLALAGTANLDSRSLFLNYEAMVAFHDGAAIESFLAWFDEARGRASLYVPDKPGVLRDLADGLLLWATFQL